MLYLENAPGVVVQDDPSKQLYPMPLFAEGKDEVFVGRIRKDPEHPAGFHHVDCIGQSPKRGGTKFGANRRNSTLTNKTK